MKHRNSISVIALVLAAVTLSSMAQQSSSMPNMPMQNMPMHDMPMKDMQSANAEGVGVVQAIDPDQGTITIKHQAIESIHWPAMTMAFKAAEPELLKGVKVGEHIRFGLHTQGMHGTVTWIKPASR
ncbi:MAG TPA: copper-binding protein [Rhodanobacteraceae bacterium]|nr:copper-binding protein [Rhodanobacteraceae bacterium]